MTFGGYLVVVVVKVLIAQTRGPMGWSPIFSYLPDNMSSYTEVSSKHGCSRLNTLINVCRTLSVFMLSLIVRSYTIINTCQCLYKGGLVAQDVRGFVSSTSLILN